MTTELLPLILLIALQMIMGLVATAAISRHTGAAWLVSSRGTQPDYRNTMAGRLDRARANGVEAITLFAPVALTLALTEASTDNSVIAAWLFLVLRCGYWLCYAFDLNPARTLVWLAGWGTLAFMIGVLLTGAF